MDNPKMLFILNGFSDASGSRVFEFEHVAPDRTRTPFTVTTELALTRRYGIRLQELPLLCREVLERCYEGQEKRTFVLTEADMCIHVDRAATREVALKSSRKRRPVNDQAGAAWRLPPR